MTVTESDIIAELRRLELDLHAHGWDSAASAAWLFVLVDVDDTVRAVDADVLNTTYAMVIDGPAGGQPTLALRHVITASAHLRSNGLPHIISADRVPAAATLLGVGVRQEAWTVQDAAMDEARAFAAAGGRFVDRPDRRESRLVSAVTGDGASYMIVRSRGHGDPVDDTTSAAGPIPRLTARLTSLAIGHTVPMPPRTPAPNAATGHAPSTRTAPTGAPPLPAAPDPVQGEHAT